MAQSELLEDDAQLRAYRCLLENARAMLKAAREQRWDDLTSLDDERQTCLQRVVEQDLISTGPGSVDDKAGLIQAILECDEQTRVLTRAWQDEMLQVLDSLGNERKLADAYGGT
jgi:hypothetical protein